jgi:hypothetical protein
VRFSLSQKPKFEMFPVPVTCFEEDLGVGIRFHEHVATRPSWYVIPVGSTQFEGDPA